MREKPTWASLLHFSANDKGYNFFFTWTQSTHWSSDVVICKPATHLGDRKNSFKGVRAFRTNWNLEVLIFEKRGKTGVKTPRSKRENQQETQPT